MFLEVSLELSVRPPRLSKSGSCTVWRWINRPGAVAIQGKQALLQPHVPAMAILIVHLSSSVSSLVSHISTSAVILAIPSRKKARHRHFTVSHKFMRLEIRA